MPKTTFNVKAKDDKRDMVDVIVGDDKQADFFPQVKLQRWDNEVNFSVRLSEDIAGAFISDKGNGEKISWDKEKIRADFYEVKADEKREDGGYEFDITLKEKPASNVLTFTLQSKGVKFIYQRPLTEKVKPGDRDGRIATVTETEARDADGNIVMQMFPHTIGLTFSVSGLW